MTFRDPHYRYDPLRHWAIETGGRVDHPKPETRQIRVSLAEVGGEEISFVTVFVKQTDDPRNDALRALNLAADSGAGLEGLAVEA